MRNTNKTLELLLTLAIAISGITLLIINPAYAQTVPKPSVPEFTVKYIYNSYDVPITTTITTDPFTGKQVTSTSGGEHVIIRYVNITIKNQKYYSTSLNDGNSTKLLYAIRVKGHYSNNTILDSCTSSNFQLISPSDSDNTVITLRIISEDRAYPYYGELYVPMGGEVDFQVSAQSGYSYYYWTRNGVPPTGAFECCAESGWSNIQTIKMGEETSAGQSTPTPSIPELSWLAIVPLLVSMLAVAVLFRLRKTPNTNQ